MEVKEFEKLKSKFEKKQRDRAEQEGKLKVFMSNLKELGFDSVKEGRKGLAKLEEDLEKLNKKLKKTGKNFKKKYGRYLDE